MIFVRANIVAALFLFCSFAADAGPALGKYFCFVSHMAGIQQDGEGHVSSGTFKPADEKFFIDIHNAVHPTQLCSQNPSGEFSDWFLCKARYELQIGGSTRLRGDTTTSFLGAFPFSEEFILSKDGKFNRYQTVMSSGGFFVSDGSCTKL